MHSKKHIILVHGACHGAWSWFKVISQLRPLAGERIRVTAIDLKASGIDEKKFEEVSNLEDYTRPLLELLSCIPDDERVILVGHSLGGLNIALAMDKFPHKVAAGVFVAAFMPDAENKPIYIMEKFKPDDPAAYWLDTQFVEGNQENAPTTMLFGPQFLGKLYHLSPPQDFTLGTTLLRRSSLFLQELSSLPPFSKSGYGSVKKIYVVCSQDQGINKSYQEWLIENNPVEEVKVIDNVDHMPMLSKPDELVQCLLDIAKKYE